MHLGYFWCLSKMNELTKECTQNCAGVGVTTDNIRSTSNISSTENRKAEDMTSAMSDLFTKNSANQLEVNLIRDELSSLKNQLLFLKTEKYESNRWILQT